MQDVRGQLLCLVAGADESVRQQQSQTVHLGPKNENRPIDRARIGLGICNWAPESAVGNRLNDKGFHVVGRSSFDRGTPIVLTGKVAAEHQSVERRIVDAAADICARHGCQPLARTVEFPGRFGHPLRQQFEPNRRDGSQQFALIGEVFVRGVVTDARPTCELTKRKLCALRLAEDVECGLYDRPMQVAMVVRALVFRGYVLGHAVHLDC
ncbi:hypothetical protein CUJ84_Chr001021 [Rhizobium leguminosarum]|uniref:Uncharacterized protein n=1 Tax=Rhizobium leguminosarum TaxID=384 RepID=A0A2K9YZY0_RHILE|nr:hypothetical protein CUJ84_Chr001021 [Rhizobium leguminosarum]